MPPGSAPFQSRGDIDAVAHQVAVALLDDVTEVNTNAIFDTPVGRYPGVAFDEAGLHFDCASKCDPLTL